MQWLNEGADWLLRESFTATEPQPETLLALGRALTTAASRCLVGYAAQSDYARACAMTISGAATAAGAEVVLVPDCTPPELGAASQTAGCGLILFADETRLRLYARGLLPITAAQEKRITEADPEWLGHGEYGSIQNGEALRLLWQERIAQRLPAQITIKPEISTASRRLSAMLRRVLKGSSGDPLTVQLSTDGRQVSLYNEACGWLFHERLLLMVTQHKLHCGQDVALPYWVAHIAERMAEETGRNILRYAARSDGSDSEARALAAAQGFSLDGTLLLAEVLRIHAEAEPDLAKWAASLPPVYTVRRLLHTGEGLHGAAACGTFLHTARTPDGLRAWDGRGEALLCPSATGRSVAMLVEAVNMELARELAGEITEAVTGRPAVWN